MCGVFAIHNHPEAANLAYLGLHALQHRGQESAGVVSNHRGTLRAVRKMGYVADVFNAERLARLHGDTAVGHVRYTTSGGSLPKNIQPLTAESRLGAIAIAHNGNLVNADILRDELEEDGSIFSTNSDTEVILQLMARCKEHALIDRLAFALGRVRGAYSLAVTAGNSLIAARDPHGFRPLILGRIPEVENCWVLASETCAFDLIGAERVRDIGPGELLIIEGNKEPRSVALPSSQPPSHCIFEHVYFARPDTLLDGASVYDARLRMGERLASECPADADVVIPVPDSGVVAAMGFARASGLPFEMGLIRNHYVGRTFIEPKDSIRHFGVKLKLNAVPGLLRGKRVVVVDDSVVRGTTSRKIVGMIRAAGASEVHVRISSPPVDHPCFYGIDTPTRKELIASTHSVEEVARHLRADSLAYLSSAGLLAAVRGEDAISVGPQVPGGDCGFCTACFTGQYPVALSEGPGRRQLRLIEL
jgi:amidophosphoribosyltransferase